MKVAVVGRTMEEAVMIAARLGMTRSAEPLAAGVSPLLGHRFTAVVIRAVGREGVIKDAEWWETLFARTTGPVFTLDQWGDTT